MPRSLSALAIARVLCPAGGVTIARRDSACASAAAAVAIAEPFRPAVPLRIVAIEDLVPAGKLRVIGVGQMLGDDALQVGVDHGPVQRPAFTDNAVGEPIQRSAPAPIRASMA